MPAQSLTEKKERKCTLAAVAAVRVLMTEAANSKI